LPEQRTKVVPTWSPWLLGATVHANDWRKISITLTKGSHEGTDLWPA
jgi:hypothetical protein